MKTLLSLLALGSLVILPGCQNMDRDTQRDAGVGAAAGAAIGGVIGNQSDSTTEGALIGAALGALAGANYDRVREQYASSGDPEFDSLEDYDPLLTANERERLRDRAIRNGDEPSDYLQYLTAAEKERLRNRAADLEDA